MKQKEKENTLDLYNIDAFLCVFVFNIILVTQTYVILKHFIRLFLSM